MPVVSAWPTATVQPRVAEKKRRRPRMVPADCVDREAAAGHGRRRWRCDRSLARSPCARLRVDSSESEDSEPATTRVWPHSCGLHRPRRFGNVAAGASGRITRGATTWWKSGMGRQTSLPVRRLEQVYCRRLLGQRLVETPEPQGGNGVWPSAEAYAKRTTYAMRANGYSCFAEEFTPPNRGGPVRGAPYAVSALALPDPRYRGPDRGPSSAPSPVGLVPRSRSFHPRLSAHSEPQSSCQRGACLRSHLFQ